MDEDLKVLLLWGKTDKDHPESPDYHPLLWHMLDSGIAAQQLLENCLSQSFLTQISGLLQLGTEEAIRLLSYWVSLHDIGKAGPEFQRKSHVRKVALETTGYHFFPENQGNVNGFHGDATELFLRESWKDHSNERFLMHLATALGGHHGSFSTGAIDGNKTQHRGKKAWSEWQLSRDILLKRSADFFQPPSVFGAPTTNEGKNVLLMLTAGLTTTSDWIASNSTYFPLADQIHNLSQYAEISKQNAGIAIKEMGWGLWKADGTSRTFGEMFDFPNPNAQQKCVIEATDDIQPPFLAILEAPTGSGKTESAFYLADQTMQRKQNAGLYIAMPTQATSNQMFERTKKFLSKRYPEDALLLQLVHGATLLSNDYEKIRLRGIAVDEKAEDGNIVSSEWFLPKKKAMLAPFGVGTVDQTFLSVLTCKHFFLRLFGLSNKVIIFDEVHAYDVYMMSIFQRLLPWLKAVNTSVIILSATLPKSSRQELLRAWNPKAPDENNLVNFPRLSVCSNNEMPQVFSLGKTASRTVKIELIESAETGDAVLGERLKELLSEGGNAAIICNSVNRTIQLYESLQQYFPPEELLVFHSRFPYFDRQRIEEKVKCLYGKESAVRPHRSVVIATQVIEQSLDLDFDLLVSELAPIDLLIQRMGRLHRHKQKNPRPKKLSEPMALLLKPELDADGFPKFHSVYEEYIQCRTWFAIRDRTNLTLPDETDHLLALVYPDNPAENFTGMPLEFQERLGQSYAKMATVEENSVAKSKDFLIPDPGKIPFKRNNMVFSDNESSQKSQNTLHALTRDAEPSVRVVCQQRRGTELYTLEGKVAGTSGKPAVMNCLVSSLSIGSPRGLVHDLFSDPALKSWNHTSGLRGYMPLVFDGSGVCEMGHYQLRYNRATGILVEKK